MSNLYNPTSCFGRDDLAKDLIQKLLSDQSYRSRLVEGPANRGKSWLLYRIKDFLDTMSDDTQGVAAYFFTKADALQPLDLLKLTASLWLALHPNFPDLVWPQSITPNDDEATILNKLHIFFQQSQYNPDRLIEEVKQELESAHPPLSLVLLVDGIDEFDRLLLEQFEHQFLVPLFESERVRIIASRRSEVITHGWKSYTLRQSTEYIQLEVLALKYAEEQVDNLFRQLGSSLSFQTNFQLLFKYYKWHNPGANAFLVARALKNQKNGLVNLISQDDIRECVLDLSVSGLHKDAISAQDFDWLTVVVANFPSIDDKGTPSRSFKAPLGNISDKARNDWLGRLQERGIVVRELNGLCRIHEEFVALCLEWRKEA